MISEKIKEIRELNGLNRREISKKLDIPYTTYCNYEKGSREPSFAFLIKFSNMFGISIDYIMENNFEQHKKEEAIKVISKRLMEDQIFLNASQALNALNEEQLKGVIAMISAFKE